MSKDWDQAYQSGETPWNKGRASPVLEDYLAAYRLSGNGLVLGCGFGHDVRLLASRGYQVTGMDISKTAIDRAEAFDRTGEERYCCGDFFHSEGLFPKPFDWVFEHTFFCAIEPNLRGIYVENLRHLLAPRGYFLGIFFLDTAEAVAVNSNASKALNEVIGPPFKIRREAVMPYFEAHFECINSYLPQRQYECRPQGSELLCRMQLK